MNIRSLKLAVISFEWVGLQLIRLFATKYPVIGFDINQDRLNELDHGTDAT